MAAKQNLDDTDKKILEILQENGRITNLHLSNMIGLSPAPTLERVRKLEKAGIIKSYHAQVDSEKLGFGLNVIIKVTLQRQKDNAIAKFTEQILDIEEIIECVQLTGDYDYELRVMVKDIHALDKLINEKMSKIEEIGNMRSNVILSTVKRSNKVPSF